MAEVMKVEAGWAARNTKKVNPSAIDAYRKSHRASDRTGPQKADASQTTATEKIIPASMHAADPAAVESQCASAAPAKPVTIPAVQASKTRLKVAAYCRVSTLFDTQESSIDAQRAHFEQEIRSNPEWEFAGVYLEAGVSGTKTEIRPELQRLIADCKEGKINLILTKSISRFSRNTTDCIEMVRTLTALGVNIRFAKENIDTGTMDSEFMLSILACLAEDESHSISGNMKWSIRKKFEAGSYRSSITPYGYQQEENTLAVMPEQAEVVRRIFRSVLSGMGAGSIAKELNKEKIRSPSGKTWTQNTIRLIVSNPVYKGDLLMQKTFMDEHFRQRPNKGDLDQFYDEGHHEAIISAEDFANAQAAVAQRGKEVGYRHANERRSQNRYCFSSILICASCGSVMHRASWEGKGSSWICHRHATHPDLCPMTPQLDDDLKRAFINCLNKLAWSQKNEVRTDRILDAYESMLGKTEAETNAERLQETERRLDENAKQRRKLNAIIMRESFLPEHREKKMVLDTEAKELAGEKYRILVSRAPGGTLQKLKIFIAQWKTADNVSTFPEKDFTTFVKSCTVNSGKTVTFHFYCGLNLTESLFRCDLEEDEV